MPAPATTASHTADMVYLKCGLSKHELRINTLNDNTIKYFLIYNVLFIFLKKIQILNQLKYYALFKDNYRVLLLCVPKYVFSFKMIMFVLFEKTIKSKGNYYSTDTLETAGQITMSGSQT